MTHIDSLEFILFYETENGHIYSGPGVDFLWGSIFYETYDMDPHRIWTPRGYTFYRVGPYSIGIHGVYILYDTKSASRRLPLAVWQREGL